MSQQQLGRRPVRPDPEPPAPGDSRQGRFVGWLGGFGCAAAGYAVFQSLVGVLPQEISGDAARYGIAAVSGVGTGVAAWLAAALLRARATPDGAGTTTAAPRTPGTGPRSTGSPGPFPALAAATHHTLHSELAVVDDPDRGLLTGWRHALDEQTEPVRPTPTGTAYGLHLVLELGVQDGRLNTSELVETLWRLRLADGGWAARSQGSVPRPEVSALVLGALARAGADPARLADEAARCAARFTADLEPSGLARTHVVTTVLRGMLRAAPESPVIARLRDELVDRTITDPAREHRRCWGPSLRSSAAHPTRPSPAHTAQAVVALDRAARVLGEDTNTRAAREDGIRWLLSCPMPAHEACADLVNTQEEVRRPHPQDSWRQEVLFVRHFTAAWMVRALLTPGAWEIAAAEDREDAWHALLADAVASVLRQQDDGIWNWDGHDLGRPLWMTYQGLSALRAHAVWMYQPDA
ncbi:MULTISPECIES: hypothetical protein [Streptomyces]|uniref:Squalene cyclase C-terminal domain-containing protein n=1 Tax=Streptomyces lasiicapitis TaxID=1923961 RepID=A0ABQ2LLN5_9ACTN|nr:MULTISPECIES: hypothetical protein [Streptomyces]GGO39387.1 hypothetical protein GCM10012286_15900 [Streptomyces lasiicapitis]